MSRFYSDDLQPKGGILHFLEIVSLKSPYLWDFVNMIQPSFKASDLLLHESLDMTAIGHWKEETHNRGGTESGQAEATPSPFWE